MRSFILILAAAITFGSCGNNGTNGKPESRLTQKDYEVFALKLDSAMNAGDATFLASNMNVTVLLDSISSLRKTRSVQDKAMNKGLETGFRQGIEDVGQQLVNSISNGGSYRLLRVYKKNDAYHALFRMSSLEGLNYHDLALGDVNDKVMINDMFIYLTGENISTTLGRLIDKGVSGGGEIDESYMNEIQKIQEARMMVRQGLYEDAYAMFEGMSDQIRNDKACQVLKLTIAVQLGDEIYLQALNEYEAKYPNDPSLDLILIDGFLMKEEYEKALLSINQLDSSVKDPYLDTYRANIYYLMDDIKKAESYMQKAIANVKDADITPFISLAAIYLEQNKYAETIEIIKKIETNFKLTKEEVSAFFVDYESFTSSPEFEKWAAEKS